MSKNNTFLSNSMYFITPQLSGKLIGIFTLPVLLFILDKSTYGEIAFLLGIQQIVFTFVANGSRQSVLKFFKNANETSRSKIVKNSLLQTFLRSGLLLIIVILLNNFLSLNYSNTLLCIVFAGILLMSLESLYDSVMISTNLIRANSFSNIAKSIFSPILIIIMTYFSPQVVTYFLALCIVFGVKLAYSIIVTDLNTEIGSISIQKNEISKYSTNMMILNLNQKISKWSDRILLGILISQDSLAEYHAVLQLVLILEFITNGFVTSFKTQVFNSKNSEESKVEDLYQKLIFLIFLIGIIGSSLRFNLGTAILEEEYWTILNYIPVLAFSVFLNSLFKLTSVLADKQTSFINYKKISFTTTTVNVIFSAVGLYYFQINGLMVAIILTYSIKIFLLYKDSKFSKRPKFYNFRFAYWSVFFLLSESVCYFIGNSGDVTVRWVFSLFALFFVAEGYINLRKYVYK